MIAVLVLILRYALTVVLYAFLGWVIYTLWRDLRFQSQVVTTQKVPPITLAFEADVEGTQRVFTKPEVVIGRDSDCDFQITDEAASSRHARLTYRYLQWWVEDLQSTNGTFLNDQRVETSTVIIKGDELLVVSGIQEYARRLRELRVQFGWAIVSGVTINEMDQEERDEVPDELRAMKPSEYVLLRAEQDRDAAHR